MALKPTQCFKMIIDELFSVLRNFSHYLRFNESVLMDSVVIFSRI